MPPEQRIGIRGSWRGTEEGGGPGADEDEKGKARFQAAMARFFSTRGCMLERRSIPDIGGALLLIAERQQIKKGSGRRGRVAIGRDVEQ